MKKLSLQSLIIISSFLSVYLWRESALAVYTVPLLGILTALYLISSLKNRKLKNQNPAPNGAGQILTAFLLTTSSLLLIQTTGGFDSFLFFLLYFLCFYIGFTLIPETVFVFSLATVFFFLPHMGEQTFLNIAKLASFLLLSPLAYFFGKTIAVREKEIQQTEALKQDVKNASESIINDVSDIVKSEGKVLKTEDLDKLKDIVEQSKKIEREAE